MRITLTLDEAQRLLNLIKSEESATKNWLATAVENDDNARAKDLVHDLRRLQDLGARLRNMIARGEV